MLGARENLLPLRWLLRGSISSPCRNSRAMKLDPQQNVCAAAGHAVAMVTAPLRPAWATSPLRVRNSFSTLCGTLHQTPGDQPEFSTDTVPTRRLSLLVTFRDLSSASHFSAGDRSRLKIGCDHRHGLGSQSRQACSGLKPAASVSAVPVMPDNFSYRRSFW